MELTCPNYEAPKEVVLDPNARDFHLNETQ